MEQSSTDESLMLAYRDGSYEAFEALYSRHKAAVVRFYCRQAGNCYAEELLHEVFLRLIGARSRYTTPPLFKTFLWTIVRSVLVDHYRKADRSLPASYGEVDPSTIIDERVGPAARTHQNKQVQRLMAIIAALPAAQREAILLKEEGGLSLAEIAEVTGDGVETIKSRLRYALTKIRSNMEVEA